VGYIGAWLLRGLVRGWEQGNEHVNAMLDRNRHVLQVKKNETDYRAGRAADELRRQLGEYERRRPMVPTRIVFKEGDGTAYKWWAVLLEVPDGRVSLGLLTAKHNTDTVRFIAAKGIHLTPTEDGIVQNFMRIVKNRA